MQPDLDPERLIFIDESGLSTKMARLRGWARRGTRYRASVPHGHWNTMTFVAGLTLSGMCAPMLLDGPMVGEAFKAWCEEMLAPVLRPGDTVIMDNLPAHKVAGIREAIERAGVTLLYLPPYSPDFNRIENGFSKLKAHICKAALLPLDDCLYALQATIPHLTRSSLHRCLQRHGISQLPQVEDAKAKKRKFKAYPIGYFHLDIAEVRTQEGKLYLFVAIDRTSKFVFVELHVKATRRVSADFLRVCPGTSSGIA